MTDRVSSPGRRWSDPCHWRWRWGGQKLCRSDSLSPALCFSGSAPGQSPRQHTPWNSYTASHWHTRTAPYHTRNKTTKTSMRQATLRSSFKIGTYKTRVIKKIIYNFILKRSLQNNPYLSWGNSLDLAHLSWTLPLSSPRVTVTVRALSGWKVGPCWWKPEVTQPTQTWEGSWPGSTLTEK